MLAFHSHFLDFVQFDIKNADQKQKNKVLKIHLQIYRLTYLIRHKQEPEG